MPCSRVCSEWTVAFGTQDLPGCCLIPTAFSTVTVGTTSIGAMSSLKLLPPGSHVQLLLREFQSVFCEARDPWS